MSDKDSEFYIGVPGKEYIPADTIPTPESLFMARLSDPAAPIEADLQKEAESVEEKTSYATIINKPADDLSSSRLKVGVIFVEDDISPLVYEILLRRLFGNNWIAPDDLYEDVWTPETIWSGIEEEFGVEPSRLTKDKILAVQLMRNSDDYWNDIDIFEKITQAFNNNIPIFTLRQEATISQILWSVTLANLFEKNTFSHEVRAYIAAAFFNSGLWWAPPLIKFAQPLLGILATQNELPAFEPSKISKTYNQVKEMPSDSVRFEEDVIGIQVQKLLLARDYVSKRSAELHGQIAEL
ncbi:hypothetical protein LCGC14_0147150 [marine sediment metagenome]|uniref:Uncharacterized protein n=1 Tax=marine sediment metagenome TaxID=412755 RepID=A0A0F9Y1R0_9ZZZZ